MINPQKRGQTLAQRSKLLAYLSKFLMNHFKNYDDLFCALSLRFYPVFISPMIYLRALTF